MGTNRDDITLLEDQSATLIAAMICAQGLSLVTQSERFRVILSYHSGSRLPTVGWMRLFVRGRLFSFLVPQSGHVYKALALRNDYGTAGIRYLSSVATQTWMGLVASLGFATIIGLVAVQTEGVSADDASVGTLAVCTALVGIAPYSITRLWKILPRRFRSSRLARRGREAWVVGIRTTRSKTLVAVFLTLFLCGLVVGALALRIAFAVTGEEIGWVAAVGIQAFVYLGNVVSITPGNLGIQELGVAALAVLFGYPPASGVVASAVIRVANIAALAALALLLEADVLVRGRSRRST